MLLAYIIAPVLTVTAWLLRQFLEYRELHEGRGYIALSPLVFRASGRLAEWLT